MDTTKTTTQAAIENELEQQAFATGILLYSNGSGDIMKVVNALVGTKDDDLGSDKLSLLSGYVRTGKVPPNEVYIAMKKLPGSHARIIANAYFTATDVTKDQFFTFIKEAREEYKEVVGDFVEINKKLKINDLQKLHSENPKNKFLVAAIAKITKEELETR